MGLFDHMNIYADIATCHRGDRVLAESLMVDIVRTGAIPKIQLFSDATWNRDWDILSQFPDKFIPSVFRPEDVDFILPYRPLALKVASVESTHYKLIQRCSETNLPLIISTGGMDEGELENLLNFIPEVQQLCLMHCVSIYPTPREQINLGRIARLSEETEVASWDDGYEVTIGWSSHYPVVDPAAYALAWAWGATQFEVHVRPEMMMNVSIKSPPDPRVVVPTPQEYLTLDEQCAVTPAQLKQIRNILESLPVLEGDSSLTGPDREAVLGWRKRWQK